jgi:hypothetical protein
MRIRRRLRSRKRGRKEGKGRNLMGRLRKKRRTKEKGGKGGVEENKENGKEEHNNVAVRPVAKQRLRKQRSSLGNRFLTGTNGLTGKRCSLRNPSDSCMMQQ